MFRAVPGWRNFIAIENHERGFRRNKWFLRSLYDCRDYRKYVKALVVVAKSRDERTIMKSASRLRDFTLTDLTTYLPENNDLDLWLVKSETPRALTTFHDTLLSLNIVRGTLPPYQAMLLEKTSTKMLRLANKYGLISDYMLIQVEVVRKECPITWDLLRHFVAGGMVTYIKKLGVPPDASDEQLSRILTEIPNIRFTDTRHLVSYLTPAASKRLQEIYNTRVDGGHHLFARSCECESHDTFPLSSFA